MTRLSDARMLMLLMCEVNCTLPAVNQQLLSSPFSLYSRFCTGCLVLKGSSVRHTYTQAVARGQ